MAQEIAKTTYEAGPQDELIVKDVYNSQSSAVVNSYQKSNVSDFFAIDKIPSLNLNGLLSKVNSAINNALGAIGSATSLGSLGALGNLNNIGNLSNLANLAGLGDVRSMISQGFASMGGISSVVNNINNAVSTVQGLQSSVMGRLSNMLGGDISALSGIAQQALDQAGIGYSVRNTLLNNLQHYSDFDTRVGFQSIENLARNLSNGDVDIFSAINDIPATIKPMLNGGFSDSQITGNVVAQVGQALHQLAPGLSAEAAGPISNIINALTEDNYKPVVNNRGSQAALISAVTHIGTQLNMPQVFPTIAQHVTDKHVLIEAAKPLVTRAVLQGDMRTIESIASTHIAKDLRNIAPGVISGMLGNIKKPNELAHQEYSKFYQSMRESFDVIDPEWAIYKREGGNAVNAAQLKGNLFTADLIRSQMNELMHPDSYIGNYQRTFSETNPADTETIDSLNKLIYSTDADSANSALNINNVSVSNIDYTELGDMVNPKDSNISIKQEDDSYKTIDFENDVFLLLSPMFDEDTVSQCLERDFPYWFEAYGEGISPCEFKG